MANLKQLIIDTEVNVSLQVEDVIYFQTPSISSTFNTIDSNSMKRCGYVTDITGRAITVMITGSVPLENDFIFFTKNNVVNKSSLLGYCAGGRLKNNSKVKAEIFSISSNVTESSK